MPRRRRCGGLALHRARPWLPLLLVPGLVLGLALALACREPAAEAPAAAAPAPAPPAGETIWLAIGGETFGLELAHDPAVRQRGLGGRAQIPRGGGMLFVFPTPRPLAMVMRDCPEAIDVAFLDAQGRIVALHSMPAEPPRRPDESRFQYEMRLPEYPSGAPAQFAIEVAGGRLAELGVAVGTRIAFDGASLLARAR